jgi:hypothetical protein
MARRKEAAARRLQCPSSADWHPGAEVLGIVVGTPQKPEIRYLAEPIPVPTDLPHGITSHEVVRVNADCLEGKCRHWTGTDCSLAKRVIESFDPVTDQLPRCHIRPVCVWFKQEGVAACHRCPGIATDWGNPELGVEYF